jgi:hypothetical protein
VAGERRREQQPERSEGLGPMPPSRPQSDFKLEPASDSEPGIRVRCPPETVHGCQRFEPETRMPVPLPGNHDEEASR